MLVNLGEVKNEGVEVQAAWNDQVNKDFSYYINGNFAWLKNRVTDTGTYDENGNPGIWVGDVYGHNDFKNLTNLFQTTQGQALNSFHPLRQTVFSTVMKKLQHTMTKMENGYNPMRRLVI